MFIAGCAICGASARRLGVHDHSGIVFDEIVGMLIAAAPLLWAAAGFEWLVVAFALFRLFDIWKPWPIGWLDRRVGGGAGIMLDDVAAAIYAAALLTLLLEQMRLFRAA
jgi:phosphatidylglycerophosphatase A